MSTQAAHSINQMRVILLLSIILLAGRCESREYALCGEADDIRANGFSAYNSLEKGQECSEATGRPILLVFSGYAISHRTFSEVLLADEEVRSEIMSNYIPVILYVDDKTPLPKEEQKEVQEYGRTRFLKTVGHRNAHYQVVLMQRNSQPLYVVLDSKGTILSEPIEYTRDSEVFLKGIRSRKKVDSENGK